MIWRWYRKRYAPLGTPTPTWVKETYLPFRGWRRR